MSLHFEWTLSIRLRLDTPESFLHELRFHLGMTDQRPSEPSLECDWPCLLPDQDAALPGGAVRSLIHQQPYLDHPGSLGLYVRTFLLDDGLYELMQTVPAWLAPWSLSQGWIGHAREELELYPWLYFYVQDGHAYAAEPGKSPNPLQGNAPPFTLKQTIDLPPGPSSPG